MAKKYANNDGKGNRRGFDPQEREEMIVKYAYLVKRIAGRMAMRIPSSVLFDELVSAGCLGLINAVDRFDPGRDVNLKTYAEYRIRGAILDELRRMDWYSRSMRKKLQNIESAILLIESRKGSPAKDDEIAAELGMELEEYFAMLASIHSVALISLDEYIKDHDNDTPAKKSFQDSIRSGDDPAENLAKNELKRVVAEAIKNLTEKEQLVISLYYYDELTLKEIGNVLGLTESRICQIHAKAIIRLKTWLKKYQKP